MSYVSKDLKAARAIDIRKVLKKYDIKGTISVNNHSTLVVKLASGALDLIGDADRYNKSYADRTGRPYYPVTGGYYEANPHYSGPEYSVNPVVGQFFDELVVAMRGPTWYDNSDVQSDYFDVSHYIDIHVGTWDRPYVYTSNNVDKAAEENSVAA
jgi:hypothetical protein